MYGGTNIRGTGEKRLAFGVSMRYTQLASDATSDLMIGKLDERDDADEIKQRSIVVNG